MAADLRRRVTRVFLLGILSGVLACTALRAQEAGTPAPGDETSIQADAGPGDAAAGETREQPELVEDLVDQTLRLADLPAAGNTPAHFAIAAGFLLLVLLVRRLVVRWVFRSLNRLARRTSSGFDDLLLAPIERALMTFLLLIGVTGALTILKLPPAGERLLGWAYILAFSLVALVFFLRITAALLDALQDRARSRQVNLAAFMPWIKRVVLAVIFVFGVLMIAQSLGANVRAFLAGLGIGGLAVALAAQDTLSNIFGSIVIAIDQPFRLGEFVQIGPNAGAVEDVGLRSTRLRTAQRNLIVIPNKNVAAEPIINLSRFVQRRVEQTLRLALDASPEHIEALVEDIRAIILAEPEVDANSVIVQFTDFGASSLDVWLAYNTRDPDFVKHLRLKQRNNVAFMRAIAARGMRLAVPVQQVRLSQPDRANDPTAET